jgi:hypothetical protein
MICIVIIHNNILSKIYIIIFFFLQTKIKKLNSGYDC